MEPALEYGQLTQDTSPDRVPEAIIVLEARYADLAHCLGGVDSCSAHYYSVPEDVLEPPRDGGTAGPGGYGLAELSAARAFASPTFAFLNDKRTSCEAPVPSNMMRRFLSGRNYAT